MTPDGARGAPGGPGPTEVRRAIAAVPDRDGARRWCSFRDPIETLVAVRLDEVRAVLAAAERAAAEGRWAVGFVAYDAGPAFDDAIEVRRAATGPEAEVPLAVFGIFADAVDDPGDDPGDFTSSDWVPAVERADYEARVTEIRGLIASGVTYQVNLTQRLAGSVTGDPLALFRSLARSQQGDHAVYLDLGTHALCSASPELFFRSTPGGNRADDPRRHLVSKPMKGTAGRSASPRLDAQLRSRLSASVKDRAENTMITDMMRNDFGRIARIGSVEVPDLHVIETYPTVHQMISTVTATSDASIVEVFDATFPPASITGAPKVSTCRIITEMEADARGVYCGTVGVIAPDGMAEFNVAIRTVWIDRRSGAARYGVGGGIVWDSDPASEWFETRAKTAVLESAPGPFTLFETMRYEPGDGIARLDRHLERLAGSARRFGFRFDRAALDAVLSPFAVTPTVGGATSPARLRLELAPDGTLRLDLTPPPDDHLGPDGSPRPVLAAVAREPVRSDDLFLRHKTTRRNVYERALEGLDGVGDAILWNEKGELTETTIGNLVLELDGELVTPPVRCGLLPGVLRAELLAHDKLVEQILGIDDLARATAIHRINSLRGWTPLELVDIA